MNRLPLQDQASEKAIRDAYGKGTLYDPSRICWPVDSRGTDYVDRLLQLRFALVAKYYKGGRLVDLCCASGVHVVDLAEGVDQAIGVDFSERYLSAAAELAASKGRRNVEFVQADARQLPLASGSVDLLYTFSSLYAIPRAEEVIAEIGRALRPGACAILDVGNRRSINAFVTRYYTDWPALQPLTLEAMHRAIRDAGLVIVEHRRCQILPLWADRPSWMWPLLHPFWKNLLRRRVSGRMLDEWVSSLPILRAFAFRHIVVVRKPS